MQISVAEFLDNLNKEKKRVTKVEALRANDSYVLRTTLQGFFDPRVRFILPEGDPPYKPNTLPDQEHIYIRECKRLMYFIEGGVPSMKQLKRESLYIELLETVAARDAQMILAMAAKKWPWRNITRDIVQEAFPGLLPEETTSTEP